MTRDPTRPACSCREYQAIHGALLYVVVLFLENRCEPYITLATCKGGFGGFSPPRF